MKVRHKKGWPLVFETMLVGALVNGFFMCLLFNTDMGDGMPEALKLWAPVFLWLTGLAFFFAHRTPDGGIEYKVW
jgi:hypothetical protein